MRKTLLVGLAAAIVALTGCARESVDTPGGEIRLQPGSAPGVAACATQPSPPEPVVTAGATMYPESEEMSRVLGSLQQAAESTYREVFAGLEVVPEEGYAIVYRVPSPEFDAFVHDVTEGQCVVIRDAAHSHAELSELQNRITDDADFWQKRKIRINEVGARHDGSGVVVGTLEVDKARMELPKRYGRAIPIIVERAGPVVPLIGRA